MIGLCKMCGKEKNLVYFGLCNHCYRSKVMNVYKYHRLKPEFKDINKIGNAKHRKVVRLVVWYNKSFVEVSKILELKPRLISWIVGKYCYKCDIDGNPRPAEFTQKIIKNKTK